MTSLRTRERLLARLQDDGIRDFHVLAAMRDVPRHLFVDEALASRAYEDIALPIGHRQTLSRPYVIARMTEAACAVASRRRVLEVGTGSGYQTAILAQRFERVLSIERIEALAVSAARRLRDLGMDNVEVHHGDGFLGCPRHAPFDAIVLCAAPQRVPEALIDQIGQGGRLIAPVGDAQAQQLILLQRDGEELVTTALEQVVFVPMLPHTV
jgi:protein-L-isoaspartate(D-aspartate) O-methyltransferase